MNITAYLYGTRGFGLAFVQSWNRLYSGEDYTDQSNDRRGRQLGK